MRGTLNDKKKCFYISLSRNKFMTHCKQCKHHQMFVSKYNTYIYREKAWKYYTFCFHPLFSVVLFLCVFFTVLQGTCIILVIRKFGQCYILKTQGLGFPGGTVVENLPANAGDTGSSPGLGRSHMPRSN